MSDDDKKWLEAAFQSLTVDEVKRMRELAAVLLSQNLMAMRGHALLPWRELQDFVESIDNAKNLFAIGAFEAVVSCLKSSSSKVRRAAAATLATTVQNDPKAQEWAMHGGLAHELLVALLDAEASLLAEGAAVLQVADALRLPGHAAHCVCLFW